LQRLGFPEWRFHFPDVAPAAGKVKRGNGRNCGYRQVNDMKLPSKGRSIAPYGLYPCQTGTNRHKIGFGKDGTPQGEFR
ncbi:hypothetical protein, partial [Mesorhizobium sp. M7A.F.Ca.AU.002.02.1.1]|uniref:hypothetical protein n=1 Tax=Mesorhizobium sp. M7A.F.Ca.AU.002.02.1.1 TaxID=2496671 RepID=UPI0013E37E6A